MGRRTEIQQVLALLAESPLITLVGPPGIGKTRLAIEIAGQANSGFAGGVWFVDLTRLRSPHLLAKAILESLGLKEQRDRGPVETVADRLAAGPVLLLLDNCEHVAAEVARVVARLRPRCPRLVILATSLEPLGMAAEIAWTVPPLSLIDARQLFLERVARHRPDWSSSPDPGTGVDVLCERLGRIPLALELAAAQAGASHGSLEELVQSAPEAAADALRAATEWSHQLLALEERVLLRRLAVFSGPFEAGAARSICATGQLQPDAILSLLANLAARSLLVAHGASFSLLQPLRAFAQDKLVESAEAALMLRRHAEHYLRLAEAVVTAATVEAQVEGFHHLQADHINIRAALDWLQVFDHGKHLLLVSLMGQFWNVHGHFTEARVRYQTTLELSPTPTRGRAEVLQCLAGASFEVGDYASTLKAATESLEIGRLLGDAGVAGDSLAWLGLALLARGDQVGAERRLGEAMAEHRQAGNVRGVALAGFFTGILASLRGELTQAMSLFEASLAGFRATGAAFYTGQALVAYGQAAVLAGELERAQPILLDAVAVLRRLDSAWSLALALDAVAGLAARRGDARRGLMLAGAAESMRRHLTASMPAAYQPVWTALLAPAWPALSAADAEGALATGRELTTEAAVELALR